MQLIESFLTKPPSPGDGEGYLCGGHLTAADILLSYPLLGARSRAADFGKWEGGTIETEFPKTFAYLARLEKEPGYLQSIKTIEDIDGKFTLLPEDS